MERHRVCLGCTETASAARGGVPGPAQQVAALVLAPSWCLLVVVQ